jgi:nucleotide-binding universal stress UspA family protein
MGRRHSQFKKILIGFDGSTQSEKATEISLSLTQSLDSKVLVFAVARPPEPATMVELSAILDDAREHFEDRFQKIVQRAKEQKRELEPDIAVGHPVEQIAHPAETDRIDSIALGRRGISRFEKMFVGSRRKRSLDTLIVR